MEVFGLSRERFVDIQAPYVHSKSKNYVGISDFAIFREIYTNDDEKVLKRLEAIANQLKEETKRFLDGTGIVVENNQNLMKDLDNFFFRRKDKLVQIALDILYDPEFLERLVPKFKKSDFNFNQISKALEEKVVDDATISAMAKSFAKNLKKFYTKSGKNQIKYFAKIFGELEGDIQTLFKDDLGIQKALTSNQGRIVEVFQTFLTNKIIAKQEETSTVLGLNYFEEQFRNKAKKIASDQEINEFLGKFTNLLKNTISDKFKILTDEQQAKGFLGENIIASILNSSEGVGFRIEVIGSISEDFIRQRDLGELESQIPKLFKQQDKQGYSDMIIELNGKKARIQSKNAYGSLQVLLNQESNHATASLYLVDKKKYIDLISNLSYAHDGLISEEVLKEMSYYLANAYWFSKTKGQFRNQGQVPSLGNATTEVEKVLRMFISDFLGVVWADLATEKAEQVKVYANVSNLFFLVSNTSLIPTFMIIEDLIKRLREAGDQVDTLGSKMRIGLKPPAVTVNSKDFYTKKLTSIANLRLKGGDARYPQPLLDIGKEKGKQIIEGFSVDSIKLNMQLERILATTSYIGTKT